MKMKDLTLARQEIVFNIEAIHGLEMTPQDGNRNHIGNSGAFVVAFLDRVQRLLADLQVLLVLGVPVRDPGIEIPAVVVKARLAGQLLNFRARLLLNIQKSHDHVGNLHARVVDVILDVHFPAGKLQQPDKGVAKNGVAQVSDMGRLIGIDAGVLNQNLAGGNFGPRLFVGNQGCGKLFAPEPRVDITRARQLQFLKAWDGANSVDDLLRNLARSLAQLLGQLEGQRQGVLAEFHFGRLFDDDFGQIQVVGAPQKFAHVLGEPSFEMAIQEFP